MTEDVRREGMRLPGRARFNRLNPDQLREFREALLDAFRLDRLDEMLLFHLGIDREDIALGTSRETIVRRVVEKAEEESWSANLLQAARSAGPNNPALLVFAQQFRLAPATPSELELEHRIREANATIDIVRWRTRLGEIEAQVCRVEVKTGWPPAFGTGFLVGPDVVLTNYHVIEPVIKNEVSPTRVALRFDYKKMVDGVTVNPGTVYHLIDSSNDWLIDSSPYSQHDLDKNPGGSDPSPTELDYALLRVAEAPGDDPVGGGEVKEKDPEAPPRRWIEFPGTAHDFAPQSSVFIVQHPEGEPLKLALDTHSVLGLNGNKTRVRYTTNTEPGSSGSPCFDGDWNLIALHHAGDPRYDALRRAEYNQGVPMVAIKQHLDNQGKIHLLSHSTG